MGRDHPLKEGAGVGEPGFRVWKLRVNKDNRKRLEEVFRDVVSNRAKVKGLYYYIEEWESAFKAALEARERAGKRTPPRPPPLILLVKFIMPDGEERGNTAAPCVIDLRKGELRIPSYGIKIPLRPSLVRALIEENELEARPEFVLQLTAHGKLRIIAKRAPPHPQLNTPLRVIAIDENSAHGFALAAFDFEDRGCKLAYYEKMRPENHGYRRMLSAHLQSFASAPNGEKRTQLSQLLPEELAKALVPELAHELARQARRKERRSNDEFVRRFTAHVRELVREAAKEGRAAVILIDPINSESLRGTRLQGTLLRARRALENLARYEGTAFIELRASGKQCPYCGLWGIEVGRTTRSRMYKCRKCDMEWDRDKGAVYNLTIAYFEKLRREWRGNEAAERALASLKQWLKKHPKALEY
jgi:uncharacterized protein (DUF2267 family)